MIKAASLLLSILAIPTVVLGQTITAGVYSNLSWNAEGGDLLGVEVFILPTGPGPGLKYSALVQIAEGGAPFVALVPVVVNGDTIEITLPSGGAYANERLVGAFSGDELLLKWSSGQQERLKRGKSYWQQ